MEEHSRERRSPDRHITQERRSPEGGTAGDGDVCQSRLGEKSQSGDWRSQESRGWFSRGYLPHYDGGSIIQHVTVHLGDSLPKSAIEQIERSLEGLPDERRKIERRKRLHEWVDAGHGSCILRHPDIADMAQSTFLHFNDMRYRLHAWVVMPNHTHVLFQPINDWPLSKIVASWKKFTARKIGDYLRVANQEIGGPGNAGLPTGIKKLSPGWHREYWDRYIRNERHYAQAVAYIHDNPVTAGLVECAEAWPWSSAAKSG